MSIGRKDRVKSVYKIALDARFVTDKMVGIARYTYNLLIGFLNHSTVEKYEFYVLVNTLHLQDMLVEEGLGEHVKYLYIKSKPLSLTEHFEIPLILLRNKIDLFHATSYVAPIWIPCTFIYSILDTHHVLFPKESARFSRLYYSTVVKIAFKQATVVLTISENSKKDIIKYIGSSSPIVVTYLGYKHVNSDESKTVKIPVKPGYYLFIGNWRFHKNSDRVIKAYIELAKNNLNVPDLVLNIKASDKNVELLEKHNLQDKVHFLGMMSDVELSAIYRNALCLVTPSLYEGFGLFLLEAMDAGIPVITSSVSCMPEIVDDAALLVDPYDINDIANAMKNIYESNSLRRRLIDLGKKRLKFFSWSNCIDKTIDVYANSLKER